MLAKGFARMNVRQMNFDERNRNGGNRIAQGNAGVRVGRRVDDDETDAFSAGGMNALDQGAFVVALEGFEHDACRFGATRQRAVDVGERGGTIVLRLARAEQVQVRAVDDQQLVGSAFRGAAIALPSVCFLRFLLRHGCKFAVIRSNLSSPLLDSGLWGGAVHGVLFKVRFCRVAGCVEVRLARVMAYFLQKMPANSGYFPSANEASKDFTAARRARSRGRPSRPLGLTRSSSGG